MIYCKIERKLKINVVNNYRKFLFKIKILYMYMINKN